jgi:predicted nucleic acid-binding Zn ribbon protein
VLRSLNPLGAILDTTLRRMELTEPVLAARAVALWPEIVGPQMARASEAEQVIGGTLYVLAASDAWNTEISFARPILLRRFRERLGEPFVKAIRVRVGRPVDPASSAEPEPLPQPTLEELRAIRLPDGEMNRIRAAAEADDPELAQAIRRALTHEAQLRVWRLEHGAKLCRRCGAAHRTRHPDCPACRLERKHG